MCGARYEAGRAVAAEIVAMLREEADKARTANTPMLKGGMLALRKQADAIEKWAGVKP